MTRHAYLTIALVVGGLLRAGSASSMDLSTSAFKPGDKIPSKFTCDGPEPNPALNFGAVPAGTRQLVLTMVDPDVSWYYFWKTSFDHWVVWDIDPASTGIAEGAGKQMGVNGLKTVNPLESKGYTGPCASDGEHRYFFRLYAVDIPLAGQTFKASTEVDAAIKGHILAQAELMGRYERIAK